MADSPGSPATAPPPVDITAVFPALRELAGTAIRLHPRPGQPGAEDSSLGGPLLWPAGEPWPACEEPHMPDEGYIRLPGHISTWDEAGAWAAALGPGTRLSTARVSLDGSPMYAEVFHLAHPPCPMIGVLQVYARDVPELPFPDGTDLFQLLWCPNNHDGPWYGPMPYAAWRRAASATSALTAPPRTTFDGPYNESIYSPAPCLLRPERVTELPHLYDLPAGLREQVAQWDSDRDADLDRPYQLQLSTAPGTKLLGHPNWVQGPSWPACLCGRRMTHLATISSAEYGSGRWQLPDVPTGSSPHGIMIGDVGAMYLFTCTARNHRPLETVVQFS
jgi:hypothetical protein